MKNRGSHAETFIKTSTVGVGLLYSCGVLIGNLYLAQFGIYEPELVRVQYILTGFLFFIFIMAPCLLILPILVFPKVHRAIKDCEYDIGIAPLYFTAYFMLCVMLTALLNLLFTHNFSTGLDSVVDPWRIYFDPVPLFSIILFIYVPLWVSIRYASARQCLPMLVIASSVGIGLLFSMFGYCSDVYGRVPFALGGGYPRSVDIALTQDGMRTASLFGITTEGGLIRASNLIHESDTALFLLPGTNALAGSFRIPKSEATIIRYAPGWILRLNPLKYEPLIPPALISPKGPPHSGDPVQTP